MRICVKNTDTNEKSSHRAALFVTFLLQLAKIALLFHLFGLYCLYSKEGCFVDEFTRKFNVVKEKDDEIRHILTTVYAALEDKGYNPINQIVGYILSEDPTYITNHNSARTLIRKLDRDELLQVLVRSYLGK